GGAVDEVLRLWRSPQAGRLLAAEIDAAGHDAVFCFASRLTQAPDVLPFLRTSSLYYAPEPLRSAYEPKELVPVPPNWSGALTHAGLNPVELRRKALDRRYIRAAPRVVTHSEFTRDTLRRIYGVEADVVTLGVDATAFVPGDGERERYVLAIGALHPLKGHELVVEAVGRIEEPRPRLVVVGDRGLSEPDLRRRAADAGVAIDIRQGIPFAEVVGLYQRAGAVACGQIREPFGLVPLESMACETPVVAVADGGFRETIRDGETGLLVPREPGAMAGALARVLDDRELAAGLGAAGRRDVRERWTWEGTAARFDALLAEVGAPAARHRDRVAR
ncbi:MAG: glycosyltransferase, partial [Solirubrobacterales bacterium]|nr:glycosyltransferase [Solirubrobacterales bacterium]